MSKALITSETATNIAGLASNLVVVLAATGTTVSKTSTNGTNFYAVSSTASATVTGITNGALKGITNYGMFSWASNTVNEGTDGSFGAYVATNFISFSDTNNAFQWISITNNLNWFFCTNLGSGSRPVEVWISPSHFWIATNRQIIFPTTFHMMSGGYTNTLWSNRWARVRFRDVGGTMSTIAVWYDPEVY